MEIRLDEMVPTEHTIEDSRILAHGAGVRLDANETAMFARSLEFLKAKTYDIKYGPQKSLQFLPVDTSMPEGAESVTYEQWEERAQAVVIANMTDDLPNSSVAAREFTSPVKTVGSSYIWSLLDVMRAAMSGTDFIQRRARVARNAINRRFDAAGANGIPEAGTTGLVNDAIVPLVVLPNLGAWTGLTPAQVLENMNFLASSVPILTLENEKSDTMLLDLVSFNHVAVTPLLGGDGDVTILTAFLKNQPYIKNVDQWGRLNTAGAAGIHRAVVYPRNEEALTFNIPMMFKQQPPQAHNLGFKVPVWGRVGVVEVHYPESMAYADIAL